MTDRYYSKVLYPFIDDLIRSNHKHYYLSVDDLSERDQFRFSMHLIEHADRDLFSIYENENYDDIVSSLIQLLKNDDTESKLDFAETIQEKIISYYKPKMQKMIDDVIGIIEQDDYADKGFIRRHHKDNGEQYWSAQ